MGDEIGIPVQKVFLEGYTREILKVLYWARIMT